MHLTRGFELARKYYPLALVAFLADLLNLQDIGRRVSQDFHIKFTVPSALPSLTQVLPDAPSSGGFQVNLPFNHLGEMGLVFLVVFILLNAYLKGGYLGCILESLRGGRVDREVFTAYAGRFWTRYLMQRIIVLAAIIFLGFLFLGMGLLAFLFILVLLAAFILLIFWDYSLVAEDLGVVDAAERSWRLVLARPGPVLLFLLPILAAMAFFSIFANALLDTPLLLLAMAGYAFLGTAAIFAFMSFYLELAGGGGEPESEPEEA